ncbi:MAG TPA: cyclase family protein [Gemmatimonadota bacterium]|nr:cyclase family protein [Gemmatimonadota bacterium]
MRPRLAVSSAALCAILGNVFAAMAQEASFPSPDNEIVDLTHAFGESTLYWPTAEPFALEVVSEGETAAGWYAAKSFCAAEHGGTHLDAPIHFAEGARTSAEIPLEDLIGDAVVVDVTDAAAADRDLAIGVDAFESWESAHGPIPARAIVLLRTGWGERWPDAERYLGTAARGQEAVSDLHFPGLSEAGAAWLVERGIRAVGIDTASIDRGQSTEFRAHRVLAAANVPIFENVASLDRVAVRGATVVALPMKIAGGTGGPLRIVAIQPGSVAGASGD